MKKVILTLLVCAGGVSAYSQATKALIVEGSQATICTFNPANADLSESKNVGSVITLPRDFIYDAKNGSAIFQNSMSSLVFCKIDGGQITTKSFSMMNTVMAPAYMPAEQKVACFNVQKEFNGYGNNEENLFFSTVDAKTGLTKNLIKFSDVSFDGVSAPFYGTVNVSDRFKPNGVIKKNVAISKPLYISDKGLYIVLMRDVTGTNRLYKIRVNSPNAAVASNRCDYKIIDMASVSGTDLVKALYFEESGSNSYVLKVGDFNLSDNSMSNTKVIRSFTATADAIISSGSIKFNADQSKLYVSQSIGNTTEISNIDVNANTVVDKYTYPGMVQFDFGFTESSYKPITFASVYKLYPNPSTGNVTFMNQTGILPNSISVYDNVGQLVKSIEVESAISEVKIDLTAMAPGIYHVKVDMPGEDFIGKVVVTK